MESNGFKVYITSEALAYARIASTTSGWYLKPKRWAISDKIIEGGASRSRTTSSMDPNPWAAYPFSGVYAVGKNKLQHNIVIPPDIDIGTKQNKAIKEIYFIYDDYYDNEFLFAIAEPTTDLYYSYGISQSLSFIFSLDNDDPNATQDIFLINYTYPQDIADHNANLDSHENLLARDGSRTATAAISYSTVIPLTDSKNLVPKYYVDNEITTNRNYIDTEITSFRTDVDTEFTELVNAINKVSFDNCPVGTMIWWPGQNWPSNWAVRNGQTLYKKDFPELFKIIKFAYGGNNTGNDSSITFNLPNDIADASHPHGLFIGSTTTAIIDINTIGSNNTNKNVPMIPNITGYVGRVDGGEGSYGAFYSNDKAGKNENQDGKPDPMVYFDAYRCSDVYINKYPGSWINPTTGRRETSSLRDEIVPYSRQYIPLIKVSNYEILKSGNNISYKI